jgi:hypothetical protein
MALAAGCSDGAFLEGKPAVSAPAAQFSVTNKFSNHAKEKPPTN